MKVDGMKVSGNRWKVAQSLRLTRQDFELLETDSNAGATRTPEFLAINPTWKTPAVEGDILLHLAAVLVP